MIRRLIGFLSGYVRVQVDGARLLPWLSALSMQGIVIRNMHRVSHTCVQLTLSNAHYKKLALLAFESALRVQVLKRGGFPPLFARALRRGVLLVGLPLVLALLYGMNLFIFFVDVTGVEDQAVRAQVIENAAGLGLRPGVLKSSFAAHVAQRDLQRQMQELSFVSVSVRGVVLTIDVRREIPPSPVLDPTQPCQIIAKKDAVICKVTAARGTAVVQPGDAVRKDQVLISHVLQTVGGEYRAVHAQGEVLARVWYSAQAWQPLSAVALQRTGQSAVRRYLRWGSFTVDIRRDPTGFGWYETQVTARPLLGHVGPCVVTETDWELESRGRDFPEEAMREIALAEAEAQVGMIVGEEADVVDKIYTCRVDEQGRLWAQVSYEVIEDIAQPKALG